MTEKIHLIGIKDEVIHNIQLQIKEGSELKTKETDLEANFESWTNSTSRMLNQAFSQNYIASEFSIQTMVNKSPVLKTKNVHQLSLDKGVLYLEDLIRDIQKGFFNQIPQKSLTDGTELYDIKTFHQITSSILLNFTKHLDEMYRNPVHGNGGLKKEDLDKIILVNEYDVQRMLFSLIRPIFPDARIEVDQDSGYKGIRYDIFLTNYDTVIEVKCTRASMIERKLTEEIGSDIYHYPHRNVYFFIYDKVKLIKNVDAFTNRYSTSSEEKYIQTVIIQPQTL